MRVLLYCCFTAALLLLYCCFTAALIAVPLAPFRMRVRGAQPQVHSLLLYCCFTAALLLLYCCFTVALLFLWLHLEGACEERSLRCIRSLLALLVQQYKY
jgi:hypothetical protein